MKIIQYEKSRGISYGSNGIEGITARIVIGKHDGANNFYMRVFEFSPGSSNLKHSHDWEHEIFIHSGEAEVYGNGQWNPVRSGSVIYIPVNEEHQIRNLHNEPLVLLCLVPSTAPEL